MDKHYGLIGAIEAL